MLREEINRIKKSNEELEKIRKRVSDISEVIKNERMNFSQLEKAIDTVLSPDVAKKVYVEYRNLRYPNQNEKGK